MYKNSLDAIKQCKNGMELSKNLNNSILINNLGNTINTEHSEYAIAPLFNNNFVFYTTRNIEIDTILAEPDEQESLSKETVFCSYLKNNKWNEGKKLPTPFNKGTAHNAILSVDEDGKSILLYINEDIWESFYSNGAWTEPVYIEGKINSTEQEYSACYGSDLHHIFITSNRKGGLGGSDIYLAELDSNGICTSVENLGTTINTKEDEDGLFYNRSTKTLYFSSKGHSGIGGFDIFKTTLTDSLVWTTPENMGMPINSPADDIFFSTNTDETIGYLTSYRTNTYGNYDLYSFTKTQTVASINETEHAAIMYRQETRKNEIIANSNIQENQSEVEITIKDLDTKEAVNAQIAIYEEANMQLVKEISSNEQGIAQCNLNRKNNYIAEIFNQSYAINNVKISIPPIAEEIAIQAFLTPSPKIKIDTTQFAIDSSVLNICIVDGVVMDYLSEKYINAVIEFTDTATGVVIAKTETDPKNGKFYVELPKGKNYKMTTTADGYLIGSGFLTTPSTEYTGTKVITRIINKASENLCNLVENNSFETEQIYCSLIVGEIKDNENKAIASSIKLTDNLKNNRVTLNNETGLFFFLYS
ncbi:MAG: hypothetical protein IPO21_12670 [Bacteroidales bacterium]|nr:hypothetical protein [Bacteroidales bacterium]